MQVTVWDVLRKKKDCIQWVSDLGDWWSHHIEVEEVLGGGGGGGGEGADPVHPQPLTPETRNPEPETRTPKL